MSERDRRNALELFKGHEDNQGGYTNFRNSTVFPYDASHPLPLCFLLESKNIDEVIEKAETYLPTYFSTKTGQFSNKTEFIQHLKHELADKLQELFDEVRKLDHVSIGSNIIEESVLNEEQQVEEPTLFVRINSAGSTLSGEDLIYSIYKAIFPEAKRLIENIGMNFIAPVQVLSLINRMVASKLGDDQFAKKFNVREFQSRIKNPDFSRKLKNMVQTGSIKQLMDRAIEILSCRNNPHFQGEIPPILIKMFIKKNQDLFLLLVYWLDRHGQQVTHNTQLRMVGKLLSFAWFEFENVQRLWNTEIKNPNFWEEAINEMIWWNGHDGIHFMTRPDLLLDYYRQDTVLEMFRTNHKDRWGLLRPGVGDQIAAYFGNIKSGTVLEDEKTNEYFWKFIGRIQYNRPLIIFAQRNFINEKFGDFNQMDEVEDTNAPWDWDHIYPNDWVYRKGCNIGLKDWNNSNGNFRAISLEHNRSRSNKQSPMEITDGIERASSYMLESDWLHWKNIGMRIRDNQIDHHFNAVTTRMVNIYAKFWNDLKIGELIRENQVE